MSAQRKIAPLTRPTSAVGLFCSATDFKSFKTGRFRHPAVNADTACRLMHVVAKTDTLFVDDDILSDHLPHPFFLKRDGRLTEDGSRLRKFLPRRVGAYTSAYSRCRVFLPLRILYAEKADFRQREEVFRRILVTGVGTFPGRSLDGSDFPDRL